MNMENLKRITDANLNRATEAARILEETARFLLDDKALSEKLKNMRHKINAVQEQDYEDFLSSRDTENDVGIDMKNSTERIGVQNIFKANIKRLQQALRALAEYSTTDTDNKNLFEKLRYEAYTIEKIMWEKLKTTCNQIRLEDKRLYLVTNSDKFESEDLFLDAVASALDGGVDIVQLREKNMPANKVLAIGNKVKLLCSNYDALFIVNDRIDIAYLLEADGVHLGQDDLDVASARKILGENCIVGVSTHEPSHALKAVEDGADYIGVGPVFATPTKQGRIPVGLEYVKWVSQNVSIPAFAIGGIDDENLSKVIDAGAKRVSVVRAIINAKSPKNVAQDMRAKLSTSFGNVEIG